MRKNIEKQRDIATAFWNILRRNADIRQSDDEKWKDCVTEMDAICRKHKGTNMEPFSRNLYAAFMKEIERLSKER